MSHHPEKDPLDKILNTVVVSFIILSVIMLAGLLYLATNTNHMKDIKLDEQKLQTAAEEAALKGAISAINEYYTGYDSPYKKSIEKSLKTQTIGRVDLPDIIGMINDRLSQEIDQIANQAVVNTFVPMIKDMFTKQPAKMYFSDMLKEFIKVNYVKYFDNKECTFDYNDEYGWITVKIEVGGHVSQFTFHKVRDKEDTYQILSLPRDPSPYGNKMSIEIEGMKIDMPFSKSILQDDFTKFIAGLVMARTEITIDCEDFYDELFEDECHC